MALFDKKEFLYRGLENQALARSSQTFRMYTYTTTLPPALLAAAATSGMCDGIEAFSVQ